ncbi:glyoxylate/hydroxypyruvate reductase HPR3-like [Impatiens glandulifera]|uniref:glyoxylate/hydroxypyruvate reductase HPR3-like n=1 Tax=Impatiens glandulifera TaxID=253017 RepID=UPI001FB0C462|nr:glyoxylate/hydroxypyruvate reductase HPR3-like [Impatiens glandulifera]
MEKLEEVKRKGEVLLLQLPMVLTPYEKELSQRFQLLKAWDFPIPTTQFLSTHATSIQAILISASIPLTAEILRLLPSLRIVVTTSTGVNHIDLLECHRRGIAVANAGSVLSEDVADGAVGLLIDVMRKITASGRYIRSGLWPTKGDYPLGSKISGKHVGIIGLGNIGMEIAKRLHAFGCIISYNSRKKKPLVDYTFYPNVLELAANCSILVICCGLTDKTHHMINKEVLSALGKDGVIVNIARGAIIDEKELVHALIHGDIAGAGLDVFEKEPLVPKELFEMDNVVLQPHHTACTEEAFLDLYEHACKNLEAFFANKPLPAPVGDEWVNDG